MQAFFRGNGTNVVKIAPETAIKLTFNDRIKRMVCSDPDTINPLQRLFAGALSGAVAQVKAALHNYCQIRCASSMLRNMGRLSMSAVYLPD